MHCAAPGLRVQKHPALSGLAKHAHFGAPWFSGLEQAHATDPGTAQGLVGEESGLTLCWQPAIARTPIAKMVRMSLRNGQSSRLLCRPNMLYAA